MKVYWFIQPYVNCSNVPIHIDILKNHPLFIQGMIKLLRYRKSGWLWTPGWLWTSKEKSIFYFIISYYLNFPRLFSNILLRQYINIINDSFACIICCLICFSCILLKYTKICQYWGGQTFPELVEKEQSNLPSTGLIINGAVWVKLLYDVRNKSQTILNPWSSITL